MNDRAVSAHLSRAKPGQARKIGAVAALLVAWVGASLGVYWSARVADRSAPLSAGREREVSLPASPRPEHTAARAAALSPATPRAALPAEAPQIEAVSEGDAESAGLPESVEEMKAHVEALYFQDSSDRAASPGAETSLARSAEKSLPPSSRVARIECKATLCRVELTHESFDDAGRFVRALAGDRPWAAPMYMSGPRSEAGGRFANELYIAREGHPIPGVAL